MSKLNTEKSDNKRYSDVIPVNGLSLISFVDLSKYSVQDSAFSFLSNVSVAKGTGNRK